MNRGSVFGFRSFNYVLLLYFITYSLPLAPSAFAGMIECGKDGAIEFPDRLDCESPDSWGGSRLDAEEGCIESTARQYLEKLDSTRGICSPENCSQPEQSKETCRYDAKDKSIDDLVEKSLFEGNCSYDSQHGIWKCKGKAILRVEGEPAPSVEVYCGDCAASGEGSGSRSCHAE